MKNKKRNKSSYQRRKLDKYTPNEIRDRKKHIGKRKKMPMKKVEFLTFKMVRIDEADQKNKFADEQWVATPPKEREPIKTKRQDTTLKWIIDFIMMGNTGMPPEKIPKGRKNWELMESLTKTFRNAENEDGTFSPYLFFDKSDYDFLEKNVFEYIPASWHSDNEIRPAISAFFNAVDYDPNEVKKLEEKNKEEEEVEKVTDAKENKKGKK